jgi:hypothetical protein
MGEEVKRDFRKFHDGELYVFYFSSFIFRAEKWRRRDGQGIWLIWRRIEET